MTDHPTPKPEDQLWLELAPMSPEAPRRLLVFLHGAGSSPEAFVPVALAWQLKFPGAKAALLQGLQARADGVLHDWFDPRAIAAQRSALAEAAAGAVAQRIVALQAANGVDAARTVLIGFSQGATMALETVRAYPGLAAIVVGHATRLGRPIRRDERLDGIAVHLLHGEFDSQVPVEHAQQAQRGLRAAGAEVTLDLVADSAHGIDQQMIIVGTTRVMQTVFRGRRRPSDKDAPTLH